MSNAADPWNRNQNQTFEFSWNRNKNVPGIVHHWCTNASDVERQTESDAYEPNMQYAQVGSKKKKKKRNNSGKIKGRALHWSKYK